MTKKEFADKVTAATKPMDQAALIQKIEDRVAVRMCSKKQFGICNDCNFRKDCETILLIESRREIFRLREMEEIYREIMERGG